MTKGDQFMLREFRDCPNGRPGSSDFGRRPHQALCGFDTHHGISPALLLVGCLTIAAAVQTSDLSAAASFMVEIADSTATTTEYVSLAIGTDLRPRVAFRHGTTSGGADGDIRFSSKAGGTWQAEPVHEVNDLGYYTSLALGPDDTPHICFKDQTLLDLEYATFVGGSWSVETVDSSAGDMGWHNSIAVDTQGKPHIAYFGNNVPLFRYASKAGAAWTIESIGDLAFAFYISLRLDSSDSPHLSYWDLTSNQVKYVRRAGTTWLTEPIAQTAAVGSNTSLALDPQGTPAVSFYGATGPSTGALRYASRSSGSWVVETVDSAAAAVGYYSSLDFDPQGRPHISYVELPGRLLRHAVKDQGAWTIDSLGFAGVGSTSLHVDPTGRVYIAFADGRPKVAVGGVPLRVAPDGVPGGGRLQVHARSPVPTLEQLVVGFDLPEVSAPRIELLDVTGRRVFTRAHDVMQPGPHSVALDGVGSAPAGLYLIQVRAGGKRGTARVVLLP